jgi:DNA invertase Pin-like site-specific DNA recombinase
MAAKKKAAPAPRRKRARKVEALPEYLERHRGGKPNLVGYARVSTAGQELGRQLDSLRAAGCSRIFSEKISGVAKHRPVWEALVDQLRPGDIVVVHSLDRIGRAMEESVRCFNHIIGELGAHVRSLHPPIDTSLPGQAAIIAPLMFAIAEMDRKTLVERTREGLASARQRGKFAGRPVVLTDERRVQVRHLFAQSHTVTAIAEALRLSRRSVSRALEEAPVVESRQLRFAGTK